ncbi:MAG: A/G-specific adenine glycosylase, partial [Verrucomicrobiota bacterium]|nr:A/G-specific adenine glycosylase [Verrucomicrobiota bacterium]
NDVAAFQRALLHWFRKRGRDLPWRRTRDPYAVLVSEIMLQQTQVATVRPFFAAWLKRFPNLRALARASQRDVLHAWQGLGYYSRARNLQRCARIIVRDFHGEIPSSADALITLPGLGRYTANAICVFAFDQALPLLEANTARVLTRLLNFREPIDTRAAREKLWSASAALVPNRGAREFQNAMMDLGSLNCTARAPRCDICPVKKFCTARDPGTLPRKRKRASTIALTESHSFRITGDTILLQQCQTRWRGMWMLPSTKSSATRAPLHRAQFPFTYYRITLEVFRGRSRRLTSAQRWFRLEEIESLPIPSPHRRAIDALLNAP